MRKSDVAVEIRIHNKPLREYQDSRTSKHWIEGRDGSAFTLRVRNFRSERILAVPTVDGLSVLDGQPGDVYTSGGYVIQPHGFVDIPGWRLSNDEVAEFVFGAKRKSYAKQSGEDTDNCGLIGVAVFSAKVYPPWYPSYYMVPWNAQHWTYSATTPASVTYRASSLRFRGTTSAGVSAPSGDFTACNFVSQAACDPPPAVEEQHLGTEFGAAVEHPVQEAVFEKACSEPFATFLLYYDSKQGLIERGVLNRPVVCEKPKSPSAFPGSACVPPRGWNG